MPMKKHLRTGVANLKKYIHPEENIPYKYQLPKWGIN
jgi:hypothetical protein